VPVPGDDSAAEAVRGLHLEVDAGGVEGGAGVAGIQVARACRRARASHVPSTRLGDDTRTLRRAFQEQVREPCHDGMIES
jgi:hypothetical protein